MVYAQSKRIYAQWKNGAKRNGSDREEPDDLRPEERRHLYCRVQNGRGGSVSDFDSCKRDDGGSLFPGANALWAVRAGCGSYKFSAVNGGVDTISGGEFGVGVGDQIAITNSGTVDSLGELQDLANGTDTVTFADGSSLSLGGQTWDQLSVDDVFFIV
jgi:hypothetical protein